MQIPGNQTANLFTSHLKSPFLLSVEITSAETPWALEEFWRCSFSLTMYLSHSLDLPLTTILIALLTDSIALGWKPAVMLQKETLCGNRDDGGRRRPLGRADLVLLEKKGEDCVGKLRKDHGLRTWEKGFPLLVEIFSPLKAKEKQGTVFCISQLWAEGRAEGSM